MTENSSEERQIRSIAARAIPLWDRQSGDAHNGLRPDLVRAHHRLRQWREILGNAKVLNRRLRCSDIPRRTLDILLSGSQREAAFPSWAATLTSILRLYSSSHEAEFGEIGDLSFDQAEPLPFQEVLVCFVRHARERLRVEAGVALEVFCASAVAELERQLLAHLTFVASRTIGRDFYEFRFEHAPASAVEAVWCRQATSTKIYSAYVRHMHNGGLVELLDTHPVLGRLLSQSVEQWARASAHLCRRFLDDFSDLRKFFGWRIEQPEHAVAHLRTDLSDRHHGGQTVTECILRTNEHVVYKPRTVRPEIAFYQFIDWVNDCGLSLDLKVIRALDRTTHGWVESVAYFECSSDEDVERFYTRCGMLLAVLYALATTDVHCENLIASGEHPVVVDLETILSASAQESQLSQGQDTEENSLSEEPSVLSSGFLPRWQTAPDGHRFDMSALGADDTQDPGIRLPAWQRTNTDQMAFSEAISVAAYMTHRVGLAGGWPSAVDHLPRILEGFREVYSCLLVNQQELLSNDRLLGGFDQLELRVLARSSATYAQLHLHLLHPEFLKDGIDRSIELEWLARPLSGTTTPRRGRILLYDTERTAMESLDIPHFSTSAWRSMEHSSDDPDMLLLCGERDSRVLRRRLARLSRADCARQLAIIEDAVRSRFA